MKNYQIVCKQWLMVIGLIMLISVPYANAQFSLPGELDTSFNFGRPHNFFSDPNNPLPSVGASGIRDILIQPDGKILIAGFFTTYNGLTRNRIARLNDDGSVDGSFNPFGGASGAIETMALQSDGKILIGGNFTNYNGTARNRIARINTDGSLDLTFNPGSGANGTIWDIEVRSDGLIYIGGQFGSYNGTTVEGLTRLTAIGLKDATFNPSGTGLGGGVVYTLALYINDVIFAGSFSDYNGTARNNIARVNNTGGLTTFNTTGTGFDGTINDIEIYGSSAMLVVGNFSNYNGTSRNGIANISTNGPLITSGFSFGTGFGGSFIDIKTVKENFSIGRIIVGGSFTSYKGVTINNFIAIDYAGSEDPMFSAGGGADFSVNCLAVQSDGKALAAGNFSSFKNLPIRLPRINTNGSLDLTFNPITGVGRLANSTVYAVDEQSTTRIILGGQFTSYNGTLKNNILRTFSNGQLDASFISGSGADNTIRSLVVLTDDRILIGGDFLAYNITARNRIARLNINGDIDNTFNPGLGANGTVQAIAVQPDGRILIGGSFTQYAGNARNRIARLNTDGSLDASFSIGTGASSTIHTIAVQSDGKILIGGAFSTFNGTSISRVARLNSNGSLDTSFNIGTGTGAGSTVRSIVVQADGRIVIGGGFFTFNGISRNDIARLNTNGSLDTTFNPGSGTSDEVYTCKIQPDGKVLIGGTFGTFNGVNRIGIARLNAFGTLDQSFDPGTGASGNVYSTSLRSGKLLIGGTFETYDNIYRSRVARVLAPNCATINNTTTSSSICQGSQKLLTGTSTGTWVILSGSGSISGNVYTASGGSGSVTIYNELGGCTSPTVTFSVNPRPSAPTVPTPSAICAGNTATITPTAGAPFYRFYDTSTGFNALSNPVTSYTTPSLTATTTYYVASHALGCESNTRTAVTVTVNPLPGAPTTPTPSAICAGNTSTITPTAGGANYNFYAASSGGSPLTGGNGVASFTTPTLTTTTTYHVASVSAAGCESSTRTAVTATVNPLPSAPTTPAPSAICTGNTSTITPTAGGANYRFYAASSGGSPLAGGNGVASFTTPTLSTTTIYHVSSVSAAGCESSTRTAVAVTVNPLPSAPTAPAPAAICAGNTVTIAPSAGGANYRFYAASSGGSPLAGGNGVASFTTPTLSTTTTYHVASVSAAACESSIRTAVTATVNPNPSVAITQSGDTLRTTTLGSSYQWFRNSLPVSGAISAILVPTQSGSYTVQVTNAQGCTGTSPAVSFIVTGLQAGHSIAESLKVYPNPFINQVRIEAGTQFEYSLLDITGAVLLNGRSEDQQSELYLGELASGTYFLRLVYGEGIQVKKLIKQ